MNLWMCAGWMLGSLTMWAFWEWRVYQACSDKSDAEISNGALWLRMKIVDAMIRNTESPLVNENDKLQETPEA